MGPTLAVGKRPVSGFPFCRTLGLAYPPRASRTEPEQGTVHPSSALSPRNVAKRGKRAYTPTTPHNPHNPPSALGTFLEGGEGLFTLAAWPPLVAWVYLPGWLG